MKESNIELLIQLAATKTGARLWRNNTGQGWVGQSVRLSDGSIHIQSPRPLHAGLCKGSSDQIGIKPIVITPEHIGKTIGVFVAIEVKAGTKPTAEQLNFIQQIRALGGIAGIARSPEEAVQLLTQLNLFDR